jgi:hypothetical protein
MSHVLELAQPILRHALCAIVLHLVQVLLRPGDVPMSPSKVSPADFQVLKVVGQGAFGKVGSGAFCQF